MYFPPFNIKNKNKKRPCAHVRPFFFGRYASHPCPAAYPLFVKYIIFFFFFLI
jgi:hypothetical protein